MNDYQKALNYIHELYNSGMTQCEIAEKLELQQQHVNRLLSGKVDISRSNAKTIFKILSKMPDSALADPMPRAPLVPETKTRAVSLDIILDAIMTSDLDSDTKVKVYGIIKTLYKDQQI